MADDVRILSAKERRAKQKPIMVRLEDGSYVKCRRVDLTSMVFNDLLPMPMLAAVQKMTGKGEADPMSPMERLATVTPDERNSITSLMRRHVCVAVIEPTVVYEDDGDETHLPVELLSVLDLIAIWNATSVVPVVEPGAAAKFRDRTAGDAPAPGPSGEDVRPSPEPVAAIEQFAHR